jgi:hypothetical protein
MASLGIEILRYPLNDGDDLPANANRYRLLDDVWERVWLRLREQSDPFNQEGGLPT